jgi:hypothetical protein
MGWAWATCMEEEKYINIYTFWCGNLKEKYRLEFPDICGRRYYEMDRKGTGRVGADFINLA